MSKLEIRLLNYLGLLDIPEKKVQQYLAQMKSEERSVRVPGRLAETMEEVYSRPGGRRSRGASFQEPPENHQLVEDHPVDNVTSAVGARK